jgi:hypothetical protein
MQAKDSSLATILTVAREFNGSSLPASRDCKSCSGGILSGGCPPPLVRTLEVDYGIYSTLVVSHMATVDCLPSKRREVE